MTTSTDRDDAEARRVAAVDQRKARHAIMRKLEHADWAMQEDDEDDALSALMSAVRLFRRKQLLWAEGMDGLSALFGRALAIVLEGSVTGETVGMLHREAIAMLVREGEIYRGCDYGM